MSEASYYKRSSQRQLNQRGVATNAPAADVVERERGASQVSVRRRENIGAAASPKDTGVLETFVCICVFFHVSHHETREPGLTGGVREAGAGWVGRPLHLESAREGCVCVWG